jgi:hypothetical protein
MTKKILSELSRKTLGNYVKKAADSLAINYADQKKANDQRDMMRRAVNDISHNDGAGRKNFGDRVDLDDAKDKMDGILHRAERKARHKVGNRSFGIMRAVDKLAKEETEVNELSIDKLKDYHKKSKEQSDSIRKEKFSKKGFDQFKKRRNGQEAAIRSAGKKALASEEVEQVDELSRSTVADYAVKSLADRHRQSNKWTAAQRKANRIKRPDELKQDHDYGETDDRFAERKVNVVKNKKKAEAERDDSRRKMTNRTIGLARAGKRLAKEGTEDMDKNLIESVVNEDIVALAEAVDARLRAKIDEALFGPAEKAEDDSSDEEKNEK